MNRIVASFWRIAWAGALLAPVAATGASITSSVCVGYIDPGHCTTNSAGALVTTGNSGSGSYTGHPYAWSYSAAAQVKPNGNSVPGLGVSAAMSEYRGGYVNSLLPTFGLRLFAIAGINDVLSIANVASGTLSFTLSIDGTAGASGITDAFDSVVFRSSVFGYTPVWERSQVSQYNIAPRSSVALTAAFSGHQLSYDLNFDAEFYCSYFNGTYCFGDNNTANGSASADFLNTATFTTVQVYDAQGRLVADPGITSSLGFIYPTAAVPEPGTLPLWIAGLFALVIAGNRRRLSTIGPITLLAPLLSFGQTAVAYRTSTVAGATSPIGDVAALDLTLSSPIGMARDTQGNLYVADYGNHRIFKITPAGRASVLAGTGSAGYTGNGGPAINAQLNYPRTLAVDGDKYLYVGEPLIARVRRIDLSTGVITLVLGDGQFRFNGDGNIGTATSVGEVLGLAVDPQGNLIVADSSNSRIRKLSAADGRVSTVAGNGTAGFSGDGSLATSAALNRPAALAISAAGDVYFTDFANGRIRVVKSNVISTLAGQPSSNIRTGPGAQVRINGSTGLALSRPGNGLYFTDEEANTVRLLDLGSLQVTLVAGTGVQGYAGDNGPAIQAQLAHPNHIVVEDNGRIVIADAANNRVRRIITGGSITTISGGKGLTIGDGGPATQAKLNNPVAAKLDVFGNLIIADPGDCLVRRVDGSGVIATIAGQSGVCNSTPTSAVTDSQGNVFWTTPGGLYVRAPGDSPVGRVRLQGLYSDILLSQDESSLLLLQSTPLVAAVWSVSRAAVLGQGGVSRSSFAGLVLGAEGDGGPAASKNVLFIPRAIAQDADGNVFILDGGNRNIRKVNSKTGIISTVLASDALVNGQGLAVGLGNRLIVAAGNQVVAFTSAGRQETVVGSTQAGFSADGQDNLLARLNGPVGLAATAEGLIYVADANNHVVRKLTPVTPTSLKAVATAAPPTGPVPVRVLLTASDGGPLGGVAVQFSIAGDGAKLSAPSAITDDHGVAAVDVTLSGQPASVAAALTGLPGVSVSVTGSGSSAPSASPSAPAISGAISLSGFGGGKTLTAGGWVEIYGSNLGAATVQWSGDDFKNGFAPTSLGGTRVLAGGKPAFLNLVSPGQINCVLPDGVGPGDVSIVVTNSAGSSEAFHSMVAARAPGLLAPATFHSGDRQYAGALFTDSTYAGPEGLVPGVAIRPASAGDRLLLFGIGFGATNPATPAGQIAAQAGTLPNVTVRFDNAAAVVEYAGVAPGLVGLYQINVVTPSGLSGDVRLSLSLDGVPVQQDLWTTVR